MHSVIAPSGRAAKRFAPSLAMLLAMLPLLLQGCLWISQEEGRVLRDNLEALDARLQRIEGGGSLPQGQAAARGGGPEALNIALRDNAEQGLQIQQLQEQLGTIEGQIAETRHFAEMADQRTVETRREVVDNRREVAENRREVDERWQEIQRRLDQIARAAGMDVTIHPSAIPTERDAHFQAATQALRVNNHPDARALFREFVSRYPTDARADDAQYSLGVSYLRQGQPAAALGELRRILTDYREGDMLERALADMAEAFIQVRACGDARAALETLIQRQPRSPLATRARARLREVSHLPEADCSE